MTATREIIEIDEDLCVGCGNCVPSCHQGALQIIDGKARLISDLMCEGIGICVGACPTGAMRIEKREAAPYDEFKVMDKIASGGANVIRAHLEHLQQHRQETYLSQALEYLKEHKIENPLGNTTGEAGATASSTGAHAAHKGHGGGGCPGSAARTLNPIVSPFPSVAAGAAAAGDAPGAGRASAAGGASPAGGAPAAGGADAGRAPGASGAPAAGSVPGAGATTRLSGTAGNQQPSELRQWPVQLHLLNPAAGYLNGADLLLAADCSAYACGGFHGRFLRGKALAIACPKLDDGQQIYLQKLVRMIDESRINTLTVLIMEVPCCSGLLQIARAAAAAAGRKVPVKCIVLSLEGEVLQENWL